MSQTIKMEGYDYSADKGFFKRELDVTIASPDEVTGYAEPITTSARDEMKREFLNGLEVRLAQSQSDPQAAEAILNEPVSFIFGKQSLLFLLSQKGVEGIDFGLAKGIDGKTTLIAQAVTETGAIELGGNPMLFEMIPPRPFRDFRS